MASSHRLLLENAQQVVLVCAQGERFLAGPAARSLAVLEGASLVVGTDGFIKAIGPADVIQRKFSEATFEEKIDCSGKCILPGLVDAHTHPVWAGERVHEFAMKLAGATYMDIHQAGGGINFTVQHTRQASEDELFCSLQQRLECMLGAGTTLVECKSGYGLDLETELKMLRVIERARKEMNLSISATYCGAHSVPKGKTATEAADDIINHHLPKLKELGRRGEIHVDNIDVFCEKGVFDLDSTRRILQSGKEMGLQINFHGDELHPMKAAELSGPSCENIQSRCVEHITKKHRLMFKSERLRFIYPFNKDLNVYWVPGSAPDVENSAMNQAVLGAELGAQAISHLEEASDEGIAAMATARCSAVLLPTTAYMLRLKQPRARKMLEEGVIVALGSDFNPNAYCFSMPMVMHLACVNMKMSMPEALAAATINAAYALGKSHTHGSLEVGKQGDVIIINAPRWEHLIYQFGGHHELIDCVITKGNIVYKK